jgi:hypothetical protein
MELKKELIDELDYAIIATIGGQASPVTTLITVQQ